MREHTPIFLFLLFRSMEHTRQKEKKKVYILNPSFVYIMNCNIKKPAAAWKLLTMLGVSKLYCIKGSIQRPGFQKEKIAGKEHCGQSTWKQGLLSSQRREQKLSLLPVAQLAYYTSEYPASPSRPPPSLPPISEVSDRRHSASKKPSTKLLLANCGVLFRGYMSAQPVIVSVIITTCSLAAFRSHHLCSIKQPAAGSSADCPGAATGRPWVSEDNCRLCTNRPGLSPAPPPEAEGKPSCMANTNSHPPGRADQRRGRCHFHAMNQIWTLTQACHSVLRMFRVVVFFNGTDHIFLHPLKFLIRDFPKSDVCVTYLQFFFTHFNRIWTTNQ